ncbi:RNA polymerase II transcription elongation factor-domain-containing protein [Xylaria intraflava]|nr:RNA polymerase II transcription elongation factor-domain-containing protein [Xylaria intraflava]
MAALAAGIVDPTKAGKYRVVLSDALLGKDSKELYTGIRYNHKPSLSSSTAPHQARIKPTGSAGSSSSSAPTYDLSFQDDGGRYAYQGTRANEENQYVLIFEPEREVFVLHRVDSMFNMNLTRTPTNNDAEDLRQEYPHLETPQPSRTSKPRNAATSSKPTKSTKSKKPTSEEAKSSAVTKTEPPKPAQPAKSKKIQHHDSEDESSDDDGLLTIEDPGGAAPAINRDFSPGFIDKPRRFSEFVQQQNEEEEEEEVDNLEIEVEALNDADGEEEEEEEEEGEEDDDDASENFKLPSPIHRQMMSQNINGGGRYNNFSTATQNAPVEQESDEDEDMVDVVDGDGATAQDNIGVDLEAELLAELQNDESDVSEEE